MPGTVLQKKYRAFKALLVQNTLAHDLMADIEDIYYQKKHVDIQVVQFKYRRLAKSVSMMVTFLSGISPVRYHGLMDYFKKFDFYINFLFAPEQYTCSPPFVLDLECPDCENFLMSGEKAARLAKIKNRFKIPVPKGFTITTNAFRYFLEYNNLPHKINRLLSRADTSRPAVLRKISRELTACIMDAQVPEEIEEKIMEKTSAIQSEDSSRTPSNNSQKQTFAVRSSAIAEDTESSFAGQYKSLLYVDPENIIEAYKAVLAGKYSIHALTYRIIKGISDTDAPMAVLIMEMIDGDSAGVIYTQDIENQESDHMAVYHVQHGCAALVSGKTDPGIIRIKKHAKKIIQNNGDISGLKVDTTLKIAQAGLALETYFDQPQDTEWALDRTENLYILQTRPLKGFPFIDTEHKSPGSNAKSDRNQTLDTCYHPDLHHAPVLLKGGCTASSGQGSGRVVCLKHLSRGDEIPENSVLVTEYPLPELAGVINNLSAVVTDNGSPASHFASVAREFHVPLLTGTRLGTDTLKHGSLVTVNADLKKVFKGTLSCYDAEDSAHSRGKQNAAFDNSPFMKTMDAVMTFISPLNLIRPESSGFCPEGCRSLHDIIRFCHEAAVQEMFACGRRKGGRKKGALRLISELPMLFYVLDVGGGIKKNLPESKSVRVNDISCLPFRQVYRGLSHPGILWEQFSHYDWESYDNIVMSGGIASSEDAQFASYAILALDYLNISLRFGYHFVVLDTLCGQETDKNYILFRFSGGGGTLDGRERRTTFLAGVLGRLGFTVETKGELVDGALKHITPEDAETKLNWIGRLLGATRLMDMRLTPGCDINDFVCQFFKGRYDFTTWTDKEVMNFKAST